MARFDPLFFLGFTVALALALFPVAVVEYPPLLDYPNHLARLFILANPADADLSRYYRIDWRPIPDLGFDLVGIALAQMMPVSLAGRVFIALCIALSFTAPVALHRALHGRFSVLPLLSVVLLFNLVLQNGFLGYYLGAALSVWSVAIWLLIPERAAVARFAFLQAAALILLFVHLYACAVFAVLLAGFRLTDLLGRGAGRDRITPRAAIGLLARTFLPLLLPFLILLATRTTIESGGLAASGSLRDKAMLALNALLPQFSLESMILAAAVAVLLLGLRMGRRHRVHPRAIWAVILPAILFCVMPNTIFGSENADWRILAPAALVLAGAVEPPELPPFRARVLLGAILALDLLASLNVWNIWRNGDRLHDELAQTTRDLPLGAVLLPVFSSYGESRYALLAPASFHYPSYTVLSASAFVPSVFATPGHQPIAIRPPYSDWVPVYRWRLDKSPRPAIPEPQGTWPPAYALQVVPRPGVSPGVSAVDTALPFPGEEVARSDHFILYRLTPATEPKG